MAASNLRVALMLCLNLFSSLSIVFVNKVNYLREQSLVKDLLDRPRNRKMLWNPTFLRRMIIILFQWLFYYSKFPSITLTLINFIGTSIGLYLCLAAGFFKRKSVAVRDVIPLSLSFCGFVVFTNLSLKFNTVGTYQVSRYHREIRVKLIRTFQLLKVLTTPVIIFLNYRWYRKTSSR